MAAGCCMLLGLVLKNIGDLSKYKKLFRLNPPQAVRASFCLIAETMLEGKQLNLQILQLTSRRSQNSIFNRLLPTIVLLKIEL
jgi:hypothetical protein